MVGAEAGEGGVDLFQDRLAGESPAAGPGVHREVHLRRQDDVLAPRVLAQCTPDDLLGAADAIDVGRVPEDDAEFDRLPEQWCGAVLVEGPRQHLRRGAEAHAAQGDPADLETRGPEACVVHRCSYSSVAGHDLVAGVAGARRRRVCGATKPDTVRRGPAAGSAPACRRRRPHLVPYGRRVGLLLPARPAGDLRVRVQAGGEPAETGAREAAGNAGNAGNAHAEQRLAFLASSVSARNHGMSVASGQHPHARGLEPRHLGERSPRAGPGRRPRRRPCHRRANPQRGEFHPGEDLSREGSLPPSRGLSGGRLADGTATCT